MELKFALLCDAANESKQGKLNIFGEFSTIWVGSGFPFRWPRMVLVARFEAHTTEGEKHQIKLALLDQDGMKKLETPELPLNFRHQGKGLPLRAQAIINLDGLQVEHPGDFSFHLILDGRHEASVPLFVRKREVGSG